jgi:molecular chaperone GrpE
MQDNPNEPSTGEETGEETREETREETASDVSEDTTQANAEGTRDVAADTAAYAAADAAADVAAEGTMDASDADIEALVEAAAAAAEPAEPDSMEQIAALNDKLLRTLADLENTRRRAERDRSEALQYGGMRFARDMLAVADNLGRALQALPEEEKATLPDTVKSLLDGISATQRDLLAIFERNNVKQVNPVGEKFDPNFHEALFEAPGTGAPAGNIIEVIELGYVMGEKLLRPARVGIAKDAE